MNNDGLDYYRDDDDGGATRLIKGTKLKFTNDSEWEDNDDNVIGADHEFIVIELVRAVQKWIDQRPVETRVMPPLEGFPDIDELNEAAPREEWTDKFGKEVGPWQKCWAIYLLDPKTMRFYTFPTDTVGGHQAVRDLREATGMARRMYGDDVYPRVHLSDTFMPTSYGGRQRPDFKIIKFETLGGSEKTKLSAPEQKPVLSAPEQKLIEAKPNAKPNGDGTAKPNGDGAAKPTEAKPVATKQQVSKKSRKNDPDFDASVK